MHWAVAGKSEQRGDGTLPRAECPVKKNQTILVGFGSVIFLLLPASFSPLAAQIPPPAATQAQPPASLQESPEEESNPPGQVIVEGRGPILTVYESVGGLTPEERARRIEQRIISAAKDHETSSAAMQLEPHPGWTEIIYGDRTIMAVTDGDAKMAGQPRQKLAAAYAEHIARAIPTYRQDHSWRLILRGAVKTVLATLVVAFVLWVLRRLRIVLRDSIENRIRTSARMEHKSAWNVAVAYAGPITLALGAVLRWAIFLALLQSYLTVVLGFFSYTREISLTVTGWVISQLALLSQGALDYLPNLLIIAVIALITYYIGRLLSLISSEIEKGNLKIRGFYPDWADPTEKLVRVLVLVLALIVAFPYLPGAKSAAFQGISIFLGVLLSLGSSSAVANAIAGVILTYMRSFLVGDWVQIGETVGEVTEKTLLVTRVLTPKAEIITIPNATVMSGAVKNYSVEAKKSGVIFHTTATIGYDAPWRTVHQLLVSAALATERVLHQPLPFVLQTQLNDFYVAYELNAYTDDPRQMLNIYSDLHQNIQDKFNEAGVEICSPHFASLRDGNVIAIPEQYIKPDYKVPDFRVKTNDVGKADGSSPNPTRDAIRQTG